jgi:hypothetical protein
MSSHISASNSSQYDFLTNLSDSSVSTCIVEDNIYKCLLRHCLKQNLYNIKCQQQQAEQMNTILHNKIIATKDNELQPYSTTSVDVSQSPGGK